MNPQKFLAVTLPVVLLAAVAAFIAARPPTKTNAARRPRITVSKDTTYITGPLRKDGTVDYLAALNAKYGKGVTPENNAAVPFFKAFGPRAIPKKLRAEFFKRMGMKPLPEKASYYIPLYASIEKLNGTQKSDSQQKLFAEFEKCQAGPWTRTQFPDIARWLDSNEEPLELLTSAGRRPRFFLPLAFDETQPAFESAPAFQDAVYYPMRQSGRILAARAMLHLGEGRLEDALRDLQTCRRLSRLLEQDPLILSSLLAVAVDACPYRPGLALAQSGKLTAKQAIAHRRELDKLGPFSNPQEKFDWIDRCLALRITTHWARMPNPNTLLLTLFPPAGARKTVPGLGGPGRDRNREKLRRAIRNARPLHEIVDWDLVLKEINAWFDHAADVLAIRDRNRREAAFNAFAARLRRLRDSTPRSYGVLKLKKPNRVDREEASRWVACIVILRTMNDPAQLASAVQRGNARYQLTRLAFALAAFHADDGKYPDKLAKLTPKYIAKLPNDPHSGKPLHYIVVKKGYLLYSVGLNGRDDGGQTFFDRVTREWHDDVAVRAVK